MVSRTVAIELEDMNKIREKIEEGKFKNISEFVQIAVKNQLNR